MGEIVRFDRSKMTREEQGFATTPLVAIDQRALHADKVVARMRTWIGARAAVQGAIDGAGHYPQIAVRFDLEDGSTIALKLLTEPDGRTPQEVYDSAGGWPLLKVLVIDNGVDTTRILRDHTAAPAHNMAAKCLAEIEAYARGSRSLAGIIGQSVNEADARRAYYWRLDV